MCKIVEQMLLEKSPACEIMCCYYPKLTKSSSRKEIWQSAEELGKEIYQAYFKNLIATTDSKGHSKRISANLAAQNLSNVMLFTHCYGSYIVETIEKELTQDMQKLNYLPAEQNYILKQLFVMHNNNVSEHLGTFEPRFTHLQRMTKSDDKRKKITYPSGSFQQFIQEETLTDDEVLLVKLSPNEYVLLAKQLTKDGLDEHNGAQWVENKTPAGEIEHNLATALLNEWLINKKPLTDIENMIDNANTHYHPDISPKKMNQIKEYGAEFAEDYQEYRHHSNVQHSSYSSSPNPPHLITR